MSHYFENDQNLPSNLKKTTTTLFNQNFIFYTDNGVFAKHGLDYGSRLLLESLPYEELKGPVLDVGCGYGVLGIIVNKKTNLDVDMIDVNKRALHLSKRNVKENIDDTVRFRIETRLMFHRWEPYIYKVKNKLEVSPRTMILILNEVERKEKERIDKLIDMEIENRTKSEKESKK